MRLFLCGPYYGPSKAWGAGVALTSTGVALTSTGVALTSTNVLP